MTAETGLVSGLARLGPHFALEVYRTVPDAGWRPFGTLLGDLDGRVAEVRAALATATGRRTAEVEMRVAVSMAQLGLAGRLVCPALGVALLTGGLLDLDPARLCWRPGPGPGSPVALAVPAEALVGLPAAGLAAAVSGVPAAQLADALAATVLDGPVRLLVEAAGRYRVSSRVLWGNVASVVHGVPALVGADHPDLLGPAEALVAGLLDRPPLLGTWQGSPGLAFRRRSCCLVYRLAPADPAVPGAGVCGDCVLER